MDYRTPSRGVTFSDAPGGSAARSGAGRGALLDDDYVVGPSARVGGMPMMSGGGGARGVSSGLTPAPGGFGSAARPRGWEGGAAISINSQRINSGAVTLGFGTASGIAAAAAGGGGGIAGVGALCFGRSSRGIVGTSDALGVGRGYGGAYNGLTSYADVSGSACADAGAGAVAGAGGTQSTTTAGGVGLTWLAAPSAYAYAYASPAGRDMPLGGSAFSSSARAFGGGSGALSTPLPSALNADGLRERGRVSPRTGLNLGKAVMRETPRDRDCCSRIWHWLFTL